MKYHPISDLFPLLSGSELQQLADDIKANGLRCPLTKQRDVLLDGRNRLAACKLAGVEPRFEEFKGDPTGFIISMNLHRRHLNESQRAVIGSRLANMPAHRPHGKSANLPTYISQPTAAKLLNVSERSLRTARKVEAEAPELIEQVMAGDLTLNAAFKELKGNSDSARKTPKLKCDAAEGVRPGDFREVLADVHHIDAIITDPPYGKESLPLWRDLGKFAADHLQENGVLITYSGQMYLREVLAVLSEHLDYFWMLAVFHRGSGNLTPLGQPVRKVVNEWKPILFFCPKGSGFPNVFHDVVKAEKPDKSKHNWGCDIDFVVVTKHPTQKIVAIYDYKKRGDSVTFTECIAYNDLTKRGIPVFLVSGDIELGEFRIERYEDGDPLPNPPRVQCQLQCEVKNWKEFEQWENSLK